MTRIVTPALAERRDEPWRYFGSAVVPGALADKK